jgi:hypothetical protein
MNNSISNANNKTDEIDKHIIFFFNSKEDRI